MEIYLIRHTTPQIEAGVCYGQTDIPVDANFEEESKKIIEVLPENTDAIFSSPLIRCKLLADKIYTVINSSIDYEMDERLIEMNFGKWEMKKWCEINRDEFKHWERDIVLNSVPGGESFSELNRRVNEFLQEKINKNYKRIIIVTHAGVIRCLMSLINKIHLEDTLMIDIDYSAVNKMKVQGK